MLNAPSLPTENEKALATLRLNMGDEVEPEEYIIAVDGIGMFPLSNVSFIKGPAGCGKTVLEAIFCSVILSEEPMWRLSCPYRHKQYKVSIVDTEQAPSDTMNSMLLRIKKLSGLSDEVLEQRLEVYRFLGLDIEDMKKHLESILKYRYVDVVFVDGLAEFIDNPNEQEESKALLKWLNFLAQEYNVAIISVIHTNPSDPQGKMFGAFGTYANRKAANVIQVSQDKNTHIFKVLSSKSRHLPVPTWSFKYDDNGELVSADKWVAKAEAEAEDREAAKKLKKLLDTIGPSQALAYDYLLSCGCKANRKDVRKHLENNGVKHPTADRHVKVFIEKNLIPYDEATDSFYIESIPSDEPEGMWIDDVVEIDEETGEILEVDEEI